MGKITKKLGIAASNTMYGFESAIIFELMNSEISKTKKKCKRYIE
jgi:hypothetical protein